MIEPAIPSNEEGRQNALKSYQILDTLPEPLYDDITKIASQICDTPIALVSLIDDKRQWFKSHHGLAVSETPKELAYCAHAINEPNQILEVPDASKDERFYDNPLAVGDPYVKFYAGAPLTDDEGFALGTLCVIDHKARKLNEGQKESLWALSRQVIALLKLRRENLQRQQLDKDFTDLVENLGDGVFELDGEGACIYANTKMLKMLNRDQQEVLNTSIWDMIFHEDVPMMKNFYGRQFKERSKKCYYEFRIQPKDGKPLWLGQNTTMQYEGKHMVSLKSIARDLSENKDLKEALETKESLYRLVSENSKDLIALHEPDATYKYVSHSSNELLGYSPDELIGTSPYSLIHPDDIDRLKKGPHQETLEGGIVEKVEFRIRKKNGSYIWMESYARPIVSNDGTVISFQTSSRDISEKKQEKDRMDHFNDGLTLLNELASHSPNEEDLLEEAILAVSDYLDMSMGLLIEVDQASYYIRNMHIDTPRNMLEMGKSYDLANTFCQMVFEGASAVLIDDTSDFHQVDHPGYDKSNGSLKTYAGVKVYKNGHKYGIVEFSDMKPRTKKFTHHEREFLTLFSKWLGSILVSREESMLLQSEKAKAEAASSAKASFLSMMSHEIRTPLNGIIGATHLLLKKNPNEEQLPHLNILRQSGDNLLAIVNDILDFNKIEEGKVLLEHTAFDLTDLVQTLHQNYVIQAEEKQTTLHLMLDDNLAVGYVGDSVRISQILHNLISNAIKFTNKGKVTIGVHKTNEHDSYDVLLFEITDTGIGIPKEKQDEIFDVFTQADKSTTRKYGGSGLGLAITKRLLTLMNSKILLDSEEGKGTTFSFELTLKKAKSFEKKASLQMITQDDLPLLKGRILLVEDNAFNRVIAKDFLTSWGCEVSEATNGVEALEHLADKNTDLVLLDLQMPVMDGYETIKALRENEDEFFQNLPVIALTASALGDMKERVFRLGMNDFVTKPFHPKDFHTKISEFLRKDDDTMNDKNITSHILAGLKKKLGEDEDVSKYLQVFAEMLADECKVLQSAISKEDKEEIRVYAHKNKSSLKLVGLDSIAEEVEALEDMIRRDNPTEMILNKAKTHYQQVLKVLDQITHEL